MKSKQIFFAGVFVFIQLMQISIAFATASNSCGEGGERYAITGVVCLLLDFLIPFFNTNSQLWKRILFAFLLAILSALIWILGFVISDHRIMCKLF
ncbi:MAG TPA: hypothetical protein VGF30_09215 [Bacteroidia bacterium]